MKGFDTRFIDELKNKSDIVDVVSRYVKLEQRGQNFWGRCPFHHEKTASFSVNSTGQFYYCFGCHKSGDVIKFVMEMESLDFGDAVKLLAERANLKLPQITYDDQKVKEQKQKKERILNILRDTAKFYVKNLRSDKASEHVEYILKRKLTNETLTKFGIGASLDFDGLVNHLSSLGYTKQEMFDAGVVDRKDDRYYDALGGRLIVPIINQFNQVVAFGGRVLRKADFGKYKNTKETIAFSKSYNLYNLNNLKNLKNAKGIDSVIMVEGYMDTISLVQAGIENVVASMGTALTKDQARILKRYTDKVYISYDGDSAGQKATMRGLEILSEEGLTVKIISLPDGLDPDDVIKTYGPDGYKKLILQAKPLIDFKLDVVKKSYDLNTTSGKRDYVKGAIKVIKESSSPSEQEDLLKTVRDLTGFTFEALKRELYSEEQEKKVVVDALPQFTDNTGGKIIIASRYILASYLFNKSFTAGYNIEDVEFTLPVHCQIKEYILSCKKEGKVARFNDLYEILDGEDDELSKIAGMETEEGKVYDRAEYFFDCIKALKIEAINVKIERLTLMHKEQTDLGARTKITRDIANLLNEKNKLSKK